MCDQRKVFGIGISKTGTTTLGDCLEILGFSPRASFEPKLKRDLSKPGGVEAALRFAEQYRSFEDSPWCRLYRELDQRFPDSKFILTLRKDALPHAKSGWEHGKRHGSRVGQEYDEYIIKKKRVYQEHNRRVIEYFADRPDDLLILCWEHGDGWESLCEFLGVPVPVGVEIPHSNAGKYTSSLPDLIVSSRPYNVLLRAVNRFSRSVPIHSLRRAYRRYAKSRP